MLLARHIDHTLLKADARCEDIKKICQEANEWNVKAVCINPFYLKKAKEFLENTDVNLCTVIGFPLGMNFSETKIEETKLALENGADEIDLVINIGALKDKKEDIVFYEIAKIAELVHAKEKTLKVIIETALLTREEIYSACMLVMKANADFVKTSTGFASEGATLENIEYIKSIVKDSIKIKASGGIRSREFALNLIEAGADRLGTSSTEKILFE